MGEWIVEDLTGALHSVSREVSRRAPGALQGAAKGFLVGGPLGAVVGATGGALAGSPAAAAAPVAVNPAATLIAALLQPEVLQALAALAAGQVQARVPVAGVPVPVAAFANLVQQLAEQTVAECAVSPRARARTPEYLSEAIAAGEDVLDPRVRAAALLELLIEADDEGLDEDFDEDLEDEADHDLHYWMNAYGVGADD